MSHRIERSLRVGFQIAALQFLLCVLGRVVFWLLFSSREALDDPDWTQAWGIGVRFDWRLALLTALPVMLVGLYNPMAPRSGSRAMVGWLVLYGSLQTAILLTYVSDIGHYDYLRVRLNAGALDHLAAPGIAAQMVWETYPVVWGILALAALVAFYLWALARFCFRPFDQAPVHAVVRWPHRVAIAGFALLFGFGIYGKLSNYPLRWSDAYFGTEPQVSAFALNPVLYFLDSFPNRRQAFDEDRVREAYPRLAPLLGVAETDQESLSFRRRGAARISRPKPPNLVVIHLESFAAFKTGAFGNSLGATPHFDEIADSSILFENFFVPSGPTARAVFSLLTGTPDVNHVRSASRNPQIVSQHTIVNALTGYDKLYFLGGSATWGNIRGVLAANIDGLEIFEEGSYDAERVDVWGVSDLALLDAAHAEFERRSEPFFAFLQTSGNHRPYTIPEDNRGFKGTDLDAETLKAGGFADNTAYDGIHFMDHALGLFFEQARSADYFENTIFAFYGDHGVPATHGIAYETIGLTENHVPGVIYAPALLPEAKRVERVANLIDLLPTCLGLMGVEYSHQTLGRDRLAPGSDTSDFSYLVGGVITSEFLMRIPPTGVPRLFRYKAKDATVDLAEQFPDDTARLELLYRDLHATAEWMLFNNPPIED